MNIGHGAAHASQWLDSAQVVRPVALLGVAQAVVQCRIDL
jgi:hypothetical protein